MIMTVHRKAVLLLLLTALLWSTGGFLIKSIALAPMAIAGYRSLIAGLFLLLLFRNQIKIEANAHMWLGALSYAITVVLFVVATKWTTAANAVLLQYSAPIYVAIFGPWFLHERTKKSDWFFVMLALFGLSLFFLKQLSVQHFYGDVLALFSGISFAWFALFLRKQKSGSTIESIVFGNFLAALFCLPKMMMVTVDVQSWIVLLILAVMQMALPYVFYSMAIKQLAALEAMMIQLVEPLLNPIWVLILFGEKPHILSFIGGLFVIGAVVLKSFYDKAYAKQTLNSVNQ